MINGKLENFLDTGWFSEATIFYNEYIYWCEADTDFTTGITKFHVDRWKAETNDKLYYNEHITEDGKLVEYARVFEAANINMDIIKKCFLTAPVFDGKTFWQVEKELAWLEQGEPIIIENSN